MEQRKRGRPPGVIVVPGQDQWIADITAAKKLADEALAQFHDADARLCDLMDQAHQAGVTYRAIALVFGVTSTAIGFRIRKRKRQNNEGGGE